MCLTPFFLGTREGEAQAALRVGEPGREIDEHCLANAEGEVLVRMF